MRWPVLAVAFVLGCTTPDQGEVTLPVWTVASDPSVTIGGDDDRVDYLAYGVVGASVLSNGHIVVASMSASQLKYYDERGEYVATAGREGDGPGEFRGLQQAFRMKGDSVLVRSMKPGP